jgi:hypothetical protein
MDAVEVLPSVVSDMIRLPVVAIDHHAQRTIVLDGQHIRRRHFLRRLRKAFEPFERFTVN